MKNNIQPKQYKSNTGELRDGYTYDAFCDSCGTQFTKVGISLSSQYPNENEEDYCISCIRKMYY